MKGCLGRIFKFLAALVIAVLLYHFGVIDFVKNKISEYNSGKEERIIENTRDIVDLSNIDEEYKINKNLNFMKNRMITAEHKATGQKMIMVESAKGDLLTKEDIKGEGLSEKIDNLISKSKNNVLKFDKPEIIKKGEFFGINQTIPYARFKAGVSNLPFKEIEGIIGVAEVNNGENLIIISYNQNEKYSQIITDAFYGRVK